MYVRMCVCVHLSPSAVDLVRMTVCMTRLLVKEKLKQFSNLCFRAEVSVCVCAVGVRRGRRYVCSSAELHCACMMRVQWEKGLRSTELHTSGCLISFTYL